MDLTSTLAASPLDKSSMVFPGSSEALKRSITQVCTFFEKLGGVERSVYDLCQQLRTTYNVSVLCTGVGSSEDTIVDGVRVYRSGAMGSVAQRPLSLKFPYDLSQVEADVVHYHLPFPLATLAHLVAPPRAKKIVATWHHDLLRYPTFNQFYRPLLDAFLDRVDAIIVGAPPMIEFHSALKKHAHKCRMVPFGVSDFVKPPQAELDAISQECGKPLLLYVGRLVYYKGVDVLINALKNIDANLCIVGDGPLLHSLQQQTAELGLQQRVHFMGRVSDVHLGALYHAADIFVLPSTLETECFGLVQAEAMLASKPVVNTSLKTGVPWVSPDGQTGVTVPPGDVNALGSAIQGLLSNKNRMLELGQNGRARALAEFTLERNAARVSAIYEDLLSSDK